MSWYKVPVYLSPADPEPYVYVRLTREQVDILRQGVLHVAWWEAGVPPPSYYMDTYDTQRIAYEKLTFHKLYWLSDNGMSTYRVVCRCNPEALKAYAKACEDTFWYEFLQ